MTTDKIYLMIILVLLVGLLLVGMGIRRLFGRYKFSGGLNIGFGLFLVATAVASVGVIANLYTYQQMSDEQPVGTLSFQQYAQQEYVASLDTGTGSPREFTVYGDECQLDARILKWHYFANLIGFDAAYRLDRLSGRYRDVVMEKRFNRHMPWIDAIYGNAVYLPMEQGAVYHITLTDSGLIARPQNPTAERAVQNWR
jgi:hypothetical protein